ncbi:hypothetical protein WA577_003982, partial [Blastocystis sp. JDR]
MPGYNDALKEVSSILERMGTNAPLAAFERIKSLMLQNQPIFNQICDIIERNIMNASVQNKKSILYLMDYLFKNLGGRITKYYVRPLPSIICNYFESAKDEMRSTIAKIVGSWARANYFPQPVIMEIIRRVQSSCQGPQHFEMVWNQPFNAALYGRIARQAPRNPQQSSYHTVDYLDDDTLGPVGDDDDLNPDFTINTELLHRTVFPTLLCQFQYVQEVWRYQLEQNKTHSHATPVVELAAPPVEEASVGSVLYTFSNWKDADALVIAGRDYLGAMRTRAKHHCDQCGVLFKKTEEYSAHIRLHQANNELFQKQKVYRGWYKPQREWLQKNVAEEVEEAKEETQYVEYDVDFPTCGVCGEKLEVKDVDDDVRKGLFFVDAVRPVANGPVYHVKCLRIREEEEREKVEKKEPEVKAEKKEEPVLVKEEKV